jgi:hypothetical protein
MASQRGPPLIERIQAYGKSNANPLQANLATEALSLL